MVWCRYFTANPRDQGFFKAFSDVGVGDLSGNGAFNAQTLVVMQYLDKVVAGLGSNAGQLMKDKVPSHNARGVDVSYFKVGHVGCIDRRNRQEKQAVCCGNGPQEWLKLSIFQSIEAD